MQLKVKRLLINLYKKTIWKLFTINHIVKARRKLTNNQFTLITQNCVGGVMYSILGKRFDSPTINLYIFQNDFCKFCSNLSYYMECELRFYDDIQDEVRCPHAHLGDGEKEISIQFTHYKTEDDAREKWELRKQRIHWDNIYIITNDGNEATVKNLNELNNTAYKGVVVFTSKNRPEIHNSFQLHSLCDYDTAVYMQTWKDKWTGLRPWQKEFDYVSWLNGTSLEKCRVNR